MNLEELGEEISDRVVAFDLAEDKRTLIVSECCDYYFEAALTKAQVGKLIYELQGMQAAMADA